MSGLQRIVFDLDGTLVSSAPDLHRVAVEFLKEQEKPALSLDTVRGFIGDGLPKLVERVCDASGLAFDAAHVSRFRTMYEENPVVLTEPFPGVDAALRKLPEHVALSICTNKPEIPTRAILARFGWDELFDIVIGGDTLAEKKPDVAPVRAALDGVRIESAVFVGDSEVDAAAARAAGMRFALFTEGYRKGPVASDVSFSDWGEFGGVLGLA